MIEVGNEKNNNNNKDRWNYCHRMPMLSLLGWNHRLPIFHLDKTIFGLMKKNILMSLRLDI